MLLYQLTRPLAYLVIRDHAKWKVDWILPLTMMVLTTFAYRILPVRPVIFGPKGVLSQMSGLLAILPGFYIASLAAIATFNKENMDLYLPPPTPTVNVKVRGISFPIELTRRRMLSLLFGYLTFISLLIFLIIIGANAIAPSVKEIIPEGNHFGVGTIFVVIYSMLFGI
jgi:hypothetical protein